MKTPEAINLVSPSYSQSESEEGEVGKEGEEGGGEGDGGEVRGGNEGETGDRGATKSEGVESEDPDHTHNLHYSSCEEDILLGDGESQTMSDVRPEQIAEGDMELGCEGGGKGEGEGEGEGERERDKNTPENMELGCEGVSEGDREGNGDGEEEEEGKGYSARSSLEMDTTEEEQGTVEEGEGNQERE